MRTFVALLLVIFLGGILRASGDETELLAFYIVSPNRLKDGAFIDTKEWPKVGYIRRTPDLIVSNIVSACREHITLATNIQELDGQTGFLKQRTDACLALTLQPKDAALFRNFMSKTMGKKILLMLGGEPLIATTVRSPITGNSWSLIVSEDKISDVETRLQKLVIKKHDGP